MSLVAAVLVGMAIGTERNRGVPAQQGIGNFGKVNDGLFRGAQPDETGVRNLARMGVRLIIDLRMPEDVERAEASAARASGITYTNVPLRGVGRPREDDVQKVLALIDQSRAPVFVHCEHGCDRTGTIIACYRIEHDQWSTSAALREARHYGMSRLERGMREFVEDFGKPPKAKASGR